MLGALDQSECLACFCSYLGAVVVPVQLGVDFNSEVLQ